MLVEKEQQQLKTLGYQKRKNEELSQPIDYKDGMTLEWKPAIILR